MNVIDSVCISSNKCFVVSSEEGSNRKNKTNAEKILFSHYISERLSLYFSNKSFFSMEIPSNVRQINKQLVVGKFEVLNHEILVILSHCMKITQGNSKQFENFSIGLIFVFFPSIHRNFSITK